MHQESLYVEKTENGYYKCCQNVVTDISTYTTTQKKGFGEISEALENSE